MLPFPPPSFARLLDSVAFDGGNSRWTHGAPAGLGACFIPGRCEQSAAAYPRNGFFCPLFAERNSAKSRLFQATDKEARDGKRQSAQRGARRRCPAKAARRDRPEGRVLPHSPTAVELCGNHIITSNADASRRTTTRIKPTSAVNAFCISVLAAYPPPVR